MNRKTLFFGILGLLSLLVFASSSKGSLGEKQCTHNKDSMQVVMRFEIKVKPEYVGLLKRSWNECKAEVMAKEPGCLDYSLFQSYTDSTLFCITEAWLNKAHHNAHKELEHTKKHLAETRGIHDPSFQSTTNYVYWVCPGANAH